VGRYLVVANETLGGDHLMDEVRRRIAAGPSSFYVIVPNTRPRDITWLVRPAAATVSSPDVDHRATLIAQSRLHQAIDQFRAEGVEAEGDLGDADPLVAIGAALAEQYFDEIIISTLPSGISRWLGMDLPHQVQRKFKLPVTTVTAKG
jgi:GABA permease